MSKNLTKNLLKSYYGFTEINQKNDIKFLATHMGFDHLYSDDKNVSNDTNDCLINNNLDKNSINDEIDIKDLKNQVNLDDHLERSWRALDDDTNFIVNHDSNNEPQNTPNIENLDENNTKILKYTGETENQDDSASDISSMSIKKKLKNKKQKIKLPDVIPSLQVVEKKIPIITEQFCDMTNSHLEEFPQYFLMKIANIKMIYLEHNLLSELPSNFFAILSNLQWFDIRNNRLKSLPTSIKNHPSLETIMLQGNLFEKLPLELGLIPKLKTLHTSGNPLSYPSTDILTQGSLSIINFLRKEWNKINPNMQVYSPSAGLKMMKSSSTIFPNNLSTLSKLSSSSSKQLKKISSGSSLTLSSQKKKLTTREKSRNYKPSNRCKKIHNEEFLEIKLQWISKAKEILIEQSKVLQQNKNHNALKLWRLKKKNIIKNIEKATSRTEEDIPFAIDISNMPFLKNNKTKKLISKKNVSFFKNSDNIDTKMREILESLKLTESKDETINNQEPNLHLNILKSKIKKIEELYAGIQELKKINTKTISKNYAGPIIQTKSVYKSPPSMIIL